jgi:hypothetical protein
MSKLKYAFAMLATGGALGATTAAAAAEFTFNYAANQDVTDITLVGSAPQFYYGYDDSFGKTSLGVADGAVGGLNSTKFTTPGLPAPGEVYNVQSVKTAGLAYNGPDEPKGPGLVPVSSTDSYFHLTFDAGGQTYYGTAYVDGDAMLRTITITDPSDAIPEPDAWALMIAGFGMTGAALRGRRRQAAVAA